jgi:hypothetical protein
MVSEINDLEELPPGETVNRGDSVTGGIRGRVGIYMKLLTYY